MIAALPVSPPKRQRTKAAQPTAAAPLPPLDPADPVTKLPSIGPAIAKTFLELKRFEIERHRAWVSDWEIDEYLHHL